MKISRLRFLNTVPLILLLAGGSPAWAATSEPESPDRLEVVAPSVLPGFGRRSHSFGTLVKEACRQSARPEIRLQCDADGNYYGLLLDGHALPQPLFFSNPAIGETLRRDRLVGSRVRVGGITYPSTGAILATDIESIGEDAPPTSPRGISKLLQSWTEPAARR